MIYRNRPGIYQITNNKDIVQNGTIFECDYIKLFLAPRSTITVTPLIVLQSTLQEGDVSTAIFYNRIGDLPTLRGNASFYKN